MILELLKRQGQIAMLIDPEKCQSEEIVKELAKKLAFAQIDYVFIGGSTVTAQEFDFTVQLIKKHLTLPLIIFPGSSDQFSKEADAILLLNLISGRNPDYLIGHHVKAAKQIHESGIDSISTSYLLIDGGTQSSVAYVSQTTPIPQHQTTIAYQTALAGKLIGHQAIFMDAGSGALNMVPTEMIEQVKSIGSPVIIGGGVKSIDDIKRLHNAGANVVVVGNKIEENIDFLLDIASYQKQ